MAASGLLAKFVCHLLTLSLYTACDFKILIAFNWKGLYLWWFLVATNTTFTGSLSHRRHLPNMCTLLDPLHVNTVIYMGVSGFGGLEVSVLASSTRVRGFKPGRSRRIFRTKKILLGGEAKPSVSCRKFTACKRTQKWRGSRHFRQNSWPFLAHSSTFRYWGSLASSDAGDSLWRELERSNHWSSRLGVWRAASNGTL